jgi:hypothetical protein
MPLLNFTAQFITRDKHADLDEPKYCLRVKVLWIVASCSLVEPTLWPLPVQPSAVFILQPLVQDPRHKIIALRRVNQFTPLPVSCTATHGGLKPVEVTGLAFWAVCIVKIRFRTGCKIIFRRGQSDQCWLSVLLVVHWYIVMGQRSLFTTKPALSILTFSVSKMFQDFMVFNFVVQHIILYADIYSLLLRDITDVINFVLIKVCCLFFYHVKFQRFRNIWTNQSRKIVYLDPYSDRLICKTFEVIYCFQQNKAINFSKTSAIRSVTVKN